MVPPLPPYKVHIGGKDRRQTLGTSLAGLLVTAGAGVGMDSGLPDFRDKMMC